MMKDLLRSNQEPANGSPQTTFNLQPGAKNGVCICDGLWEQQKQRLCDRNPMWLQRLIYLLSGPL